MPTMRRATEGEEYRWILVALLAACAILSSRWLITLVTTPEQLFPDFFAFWTYGRYVLTHAPAGVYDEAALHAYRTGFGMPEDFDYSFLYPPWILLLLAPFGALPYPVARVAWMVLTFAVYAAALTAWRWPRPVAALLLVAPSSAVCFVVGQNGFVVAALMLGGLRLLQTRPWLAGALLASVGYRPQFAVLVPFMLLFGRHWRAMAGAGLAVLLLSLATTLAFGAGIWGAWLDFMRAQAIPLTVGREPLRDMMPTVTSAVMLLGGGAAMAHVAQAAGVLAGLLALWRVRARHDPAALAVLPLATLLATPYAFHYDLPLTTGAVLAVIAVRVAVAERFDQGELPLLLGCVVAPIIPILRVGAGVPILATVVPAVFAGTLFMMSRSLKN